VGVGVCYAEDLSVVDVEEELHLAFHISVTLYSR
jgi:hypothetical protein